MLTMATIAKIRRDHIRDGKSIKAIAHARGVPRNTVRKVLRKDETEFQYERRAPAVYPSWALFRAGWRNCWRGMPASPSASV